MSDFYIKCCPTTSFLIQKDKLDPCLPFLPGEPLEEGAWFRIRSFTHKVVVHRYFDHVVIFCILLSSVTLVSIVKFFVV